MKGIIRRELTFESMPCIHVNLLCLGYLLQKFLDDHSIVITYFTRK